MLQRRDGRRMTPAPLPTESGTYVLILRSQDRGTARMGNVGRVHIAPGFYLYVGSAFGPGGLRARVSRHLRGASKPHWHIDYLRRRADPVAVWFQPDCLPHEHRWAEIVGRGRGIEEACPRFGASDCRCDTHLFFSEAPPSLEAFQRRLGSAGLSSGIYEVPAAESERLDEVGAIFALRN